MQKEITIVPKDKCPLSVLAEMGEQTRNAWIFLHANAMLLLSYDADHHQLDFHNNYRCIWDATETHSKITIDISDYGNLWCKVYHICASNIAFEFAPGDPDELIFLKMAE